MADDLKKAQYMEVIETLCRSLAQAHDEILRLQNVPREKWPDMDWPEWSHPANSIRWAEQLLSKPLGKNTALLPSPAAETEGSRG